MPDADRPTSCEGGLTRYLRRPDGSREALVTLDVAKDPEDEYGGKASETIPTADLQPGAYKLWAVDRCSGLETETETVDVIVLEEPPDGEPPVEGVIAAGGAHTCALTTA